MHLKLVNSEKITANKLSDKNTQNANQPQVNCAPSPVQVPVYVFRPKNSPGRHRYPARKLTQIN